MNTGILMRKINKSKILNFIYIGLITISATCLTIALGFTFGYAFAYVLGFIK